VVETCYVPVLVLGGPYHTDPSATLDMVGRAMQVGAKGAVVGRNIWKAEDPSQMVQALSQLIHNHE